MRSGRRTWDTRAAAAVLSTLVIAGAPACAPRAGVAPRAPTARSAAVHPIEVTDDKFAATTAEILRTRESSPERTNGLIGVVRYQLARAANLFDTGHDEAGLDAVEGAIYLVRAGEFHPTMLAGRTKPLLAAANAVARHGTEGRALALYSMLSRALPQGQERAEVDAHLVAIKQWEETTRSRGPLQAAGGDERAAVDRALWDPSNESLRAARDAIVEWIDRAMSYGKDQVPPSDDFERDEAIEAYRAVRTGAMALAALYLRNGDPAGALSAMENPRVARVVSPHLHEGLRRAAEERDPEAWLELFATFDRLGTAETDVALDPELSQAAAWGAAVELFRVEPTTLRGVMPVSTLLMRHRMAEVAPRLLEPAIEAANRAEASSWALGYVLEALLSADASGDISAAQRTFRESSPLLSWVEQQPHAKEVSPSVARVRYAMGALEARAGDLAAARPLVEAAVKAEPTLPGFELLAAIDRQQGNSTAALSSLDSVAKIATQSSDPAAVAEAELTKYEVYRDQGDPASAAKALETALYRALDARQLAHTGAEQANAERMLARVLDQYGSLDGARRATSRAYEASRTDPRQLTATVLDAARRGLTYGDIRTTRDAVRHALDANLAHEDLVYAALWLRLLERRLGIPSDGTVEEAFARIDDDDGWAARLRAWGTGRLSDEQLLAAAKTRVEQTEAAFYTAMAAYAANDAHAAERLDRIAKSDSIELVEVAIARDLSPDKKRVDVKLPPQVELP